MLYFLMINLETTNIMVIKKKGICTNSGLPWLLTLNCSVFEIFKVELYLHFENVTEVNVNE